MYLHFVTQAGSFSGLTGDGYWDALLDGKPDEAFAAEGGPRPPAKDPDYAAFANRVYERCEHDPTSDVRSNAAMTNCYERVMQTELAMLTAKRRQAGLSKLLQKWKAFRSDLCAVDGVATSSQAAGIVREFDERTQCVWLASVRGSFLVHAWATDDAAAFARHVAHRSGWSKEVRKGADYLARVIKGPPCGGDFPEERPCRVEGVRQAEWIRGHRALRRLPNETRELASALCGAWPALADRMGQDCAKQVEDYFYSYGHILGFVGGTD